MGADSPPRPARSESRPGYDPPRSVPCSSIRVRPLAALLVGLAAACGSAPEEQAATAPSLAPGPAFPDERQIHWQRSLDDALAISAAEGRPIFVAVNADGESASERIVRELYRDPRFVSLTRRFVCVVASPFRHSPRDFD